MATEKLYWRDPFATAFEATGARLATFGGARSIVLPETLFYPEAGGQLGDTGTLEIGGRRLAVIDTQIDEAGEIHHVLGAADVTGLDAGAVRGEISSSRRRDHMAQHTAQHLLSRALLDVGKAETVSARLGATLCTIDVDRPALPEARLAEAEDLVNAVVQSDVLVRALFPSPEELAAMPLRRPPKVDAHVRIIEVEGFDLTPCGGTHCTRTGQIGVLMVAGVEKYKGMLRVSFHAAGRAIDDARKKQRVLGDLARELTCGVLEVGAGVAKLRADLKARGDALSAARGELASLVASARLADAPVDPSGTTLVVLRREKDDLGSLRALAARLAARPDVVALCVADDPEDAAHVFVVAQRGASASFDCGAWLKAKAAEHGGRGGGRPERAEGRIAKAAPLP